MQGRDGGARVPLFTFQSLVHGRDLESDNGCHGMLDQRIGNDAMRRGIRQLGIHRPPAHELANWFESAVVARLLLPEQVDAAIFPGSTGYSGRWMPRKWQSPMDKGMIGGLRPPRRIGYM